MPAKSKAQEEFLAIHHPEVLEKWKTEGADLSTKGLPGHVSHGMKPQGQRRRLAKMLRRAR